MRFLNDWIFTFFFNSPKTERAYWWVLGCQRIWTTFAKMPYWLADRSQNIHKQLISVVTIIWQGVQACRKHWVQCQCFRLNLKLALYPLLYYTVKLQYAKFVSKSNNINRINYTVWLCINPLAWKWLHNHPDILGYLSFAEATNPHWVGRVIYKHRRQQKQNRKKEQQQHKMHSTDDVRINRKVFCFYYRLLPASSVPVVALQMLVSSASG